MKCIVRFYIRNLKNILQWHTNQLERIVRFGIDMLQDKLLLNKDRSEHTCRYRRRILQNKERLDSYLMADIGRYYMYNLVDRQY